MPDLCFPVRPTPFTDESIKGYTFRLLMRNGRENLNELFSILNLKISVNCFNYDTTEFNRFIKALAPFIWLKPHELKRCFNSKLNKLHYDDFRFIRSFKVQSVKLCPCCIQDDDGYLKASWELANVTHCEKHNCLLVDSCPKCHTKIEWHSDLFRGCTSCEHIWSSKDVNESLLPVYQKEFLYRTIKQRPILNCLANALIIVMRPHDYMYESVKTLKQSNEQMHYYMLQAHELLTNSDYRDEWLSKFSAYGIYPSIEGRFIPEVLSNLAAEYPIRKPEKSVSLQPIPATEIVRKNRLALEHYCPAEHQISLNEASLILNLSSRQTSSLRDIGLIVSINSPLKNKDLLFDLRKVAEVTESILTRCSLANNTQISALMKISDLYTEVGLYLISKPKIIQVLNNSNRLKLYKTRATKVWHDILVDKDNFLQVLESIYTQYIPNDIPLARSGKLFGLSPMLMDVLLENFSTYFPNIKTGESININETSKFLSDYLVLNRWCKLNGFQPFQIYDLLQEKGINPIFLNDEFRKVYVYKQCPRLNNALEVIKQSLEKTDPNIIILKEAYLLSIKDKTELEPIATVLFGRIKKAASGYPVGSRVLTPNIISKEKKRPFTSQTGKTYNTFGTVKTLQISFEEWTYLKNNQTSPEDIIKFRMSN